MRKATPISISIFNIKGQKVKTLINNELKEGEYHLSWDGKDNNGRTCSSGVYYYQIAAPNQNITKKMLLLK
jgi:flagellar hook assembly protein FlgD